MVVNFRLATLKADQHIKELRIKNMFKDLFKPKTFFKHDLIVDTSKQVKTQSSVNKLA